MLIYILDYSVGNLKSIEKAFKKFGVKCIISRDPRYVKECDAIILPGVGSFDSAIENIPEEILDEMKSLYIFGICLGMQLLFEESEEGHRKGLSLLKGCVKKIRNVNILPHIGWNSIKILKDSELLRDIRDGSHFYFVHSYYCVPEEDITLATCKYGIEFPAVVEKKNIFATQFHPEKSGKNGLKIIENFINIVKK